MIVKIPKKSTCFQWHNWRGICVLPAVGNVIAKTILARINEYLQSLINREQAGFRSGTSCIDHITVGIIWEQCEEFRSSLHLLFLRRFGESCREGEFMPEKLIAIARATYIGAKYHVLHRGKMSEEFEVQSGVRQFNGR